MLETDAKSVTNIVKLNSFLQMKSTYLLFLVLASLSTHCISAQTQTCGSIVSCQNWNFGQPCYGFRSAGTCHRSLIFPPESFRSGYVREGNIVCTGFSETDCRGDTFAITRTGLNYPFVMRSFICPSFVC